MDEASFWYEVTTEVVCLLHKCPVPPEERETSFVMKAYVHKAVALPLLAIPAFAELSFRIVQ